MWNVENRQTDISFRNVSVNESENCRDRIVLWFDQNSHAMQCNATLWRKTEKTFCHQSATISSECTVLLMSGLDLVIKTCFNVQCCFRCGIWSQSWLTCFTFVFLKSKHIFQKVFFPNNYVDVRHTPMLGKPTCKSNYGSEDKHPNSSLVLEQVQFFRKSFLSKLLRRTHQDYKRTRYCVSWDVASNRCSLSSILGYAGLTCWKIVFVLTTHVFHVQPASSRCQGGGHLKWVSSRQRPSPICLHPYNLILFIVALQITLREHKKEH